MASVNKVTTFDAPIEKIFETLIDYEKYPDFVDGVDEIKILEMDEQGARVEYTLNVIKKLNYVLKLTHEKPTKLSWELESGDIFKVNSGSWQLKDLGEGRTEVKYDLDVDVKMFVPKMVTKKLVEGNLPKMLKAYEDQARTR
jgi:ribosome-associated toxin RatA of RatAB toxin-antitoxin module